MAEDGVLDINDELEDLKISEVFEKVEYFRKKGRIIKDQIHTNDLDETIVIWGDGRRGRGTLKGVMVAYASNEDGLVKIGFSMCHPTDKWDHVNGAHNPGWGKQIATDRAEKWISKSNAMVHKNMEAALGVMREGLNDAELLQSIKNSVIIPDTMHGSLKTFVERCRKYFKDKRFPEWVDKL